MLKSGLVSVTFRSLPPREIISLAATARLEGIEWGGDVHVPPGDRVLAQNVYYMTVDAGLEVSSYGSYYYAGEHPPERGLAVVETAVALHAPVIRIWAGKRGSAIADAEYRQRVTSGARAIADVAAAAGIITAFEFHQNTLADSHAAAMALLDEIHHDNIRMYWQTQRGTTQDERKEGLRKFMPRLGNIHVFNEGRNPLASAKAPWQVYLTLAQASTSTHWALLEFVKDNSQDSFRTDASTLLELLNEVR